MTTFLWLNILVFLGLHYLKVGSNAEPFRAKHVFYGGPTFSAVILVTWAFILQCSKR